MDKTVMQGYKLYKKAWIYAAGNPLQERKLTNVSLRSLLNRGGYVISTILTVRRRLSFGM